MPEKRKSQGPRPKIADIPPFDQGPPDNLDDLFEDVRPLNPLLDCLICGARGAGPDPGHVCPPRSTPLLGILNTSTIEDIAANVVRVEGTVPVDEAYLVSGLTLDAEGRPHVVDAYKITGLGGASGGFAPADGWGGPPAFVQRPPPSMRPTTGPELVELLERLQRAYEGADGDLWGDDQFGPDLDAAIEAARRIPPVVKLRPPPSSEAPDA